MAQVTLDEYTFTYTPKKRPLKPVMRPRTPKGPRDHLWVTTNGETVVMSEMTDEHLRNTLTFIKRYAPTYREQAHRRAGSPMNKQMWYFRDGPLQEVYVPFAWLLEEATKRGMKTTTWTNAPVKKKV